MNKPFKSTKLGKALTFVAKVADNAVLAGAVTNVLEESKLGEKVSPKGSVDWSKLIGAAIPILLILGLLFGVIDLETVKELLKLTE